MKFERWKASTFPDLGQIRTWTNSEPDDKFIAFEFGPGLNYYVQRVQRLMLSGGRVLDAGCGMGQWSVALATAFDHVDAVDTNPHRLDVLSNLCSHLGVTNVRGHEGTIESLPFEDEYFDAVFCYGVIMFTDLQKSLNEFNRVLQPGGRIYVCLNADGFSHHLINDRGDTASVNAGSETLYNTYWRRALAEGFSDDLLHEKEHWTRIYRVARQIDRITRGILRLPWITQTSIGRWLVANEKGIVEKHGFVLSRVGRRLVAEVEQHLPASYRTRLLSDISRIVQEGGLPTQMTQAQSYMPKEFSLEVEQAGFTQFESGPESSIVTENWVPDIEPKYQPQHHSGFPTVWEGLFLKPTVLDVPVSLQVHLDAGMTASRTKVFVSGTPNVILSNMTESSFPSELLEWAHRKARALGGAKYIEKLGAVLRESGDTHPELIASRIICFVQGALYRDPISQPLEKDGSLPDPLVILCTARGKCGHAAKLVVALAEAAGLQARVRQFPHHVSAEISVNGQWVLAEADIFKNGILTKKKDGHLITLDEWKKRPTLLDCFPATGWMVLPGSWSARDWLGNPTKGYVDVLTPADRGFVSNYFVESTAGAPPTLAHITEIRRDDDFLSLRWDPSTLDKGRVIGYKVRIGTTSRGWNYATSVAGDNFASQTGADITELETTDCAVRVFAKQGPPIYASVTAVSDRIELEPNTWFWPSEEVCLES